MKASGISLSGGLSIIAPSGGAASDPYFANVQLLMPMNGPNNSTTFTDSSSFSRPVTRTGALITTAQSKWGGSSAAFDGSGDYLSIPYNANLIQWQDVDFTIEYWIYVVDMSTMSSSNFPSTIGQGLVGAPTTIYWSFGPMTTGKVQFYWWSGQQNYVLSDETITINTWNHLAMTKTSSGVKVFVNGIGKSGSGATASYGNLPLIIGQLNNRAINAYINDVRITRGVARYTNNFTVPNAAFPTS